MKPSLHTWPMAIVAALAAGCQYMPLGGGGGSAGNTRSDPAAPAPGGRQEASRPAPPPKPRPIVLPEGTLLTAELGTGLSSASAQPGDLVVAKLLEDVRADGRLALPAGSELRGRVTAAVSSGKVKGRARLAFAFDSVEAKGRTHEIETSSIDVTAASTRKRDKALIGGGAGAGGLIGALAGGKKGAGIGVLVGAGAGGGAVLLTKGKEVQFNAGARLRLELAREARLE